MMLKIGLTGGIGSGKSVVARIFSVLGTSVYHADEKAKFLMEEDPGLKTAIKSLLGNDAYREGELNRKYISQLVFKDKKVLDQLNAIVHPAVRDDFYSWCKGKQNEVYVVEEAALLFETGFYREFDYNILVTAPEAIRIKRVMERDNIPEISVIERMKNQMEEHLKLNLCDFEIENSGTELLVPRVLELHNKFVSLQK